MADSRSLTFDELEITSENGSSDLNVEFLRIADSSESAFMAYEQILRNRGRLTDADAVYFVIPEPIRLWASGRKNIRNDIDGDCAARSPARSLLGRTYGA